MAFLRRCILARRRADKEKKKVPRHFRQFNFGSPFLVGHVGSLGISSPTEPSFSPRPPLWATLAPHPQRYSPRLAPRRAACFASSKRGQSTERAEDDPHPSSPASLPRLLNIVSLRTLLRHTHPPPPPSERLATRHPRCACTDTRRRCTLPSPPRPHRP